MKKPKQGVWYGWDSRGGIRMQPDCIQIVDFDLAANLAEWRKTGAAITGSIESGRLTYQIGTVKCELWREDQPNPTAYTKVVNPDPWPSRTGDPALVRIKEWTE